MALHVEINQTLDRLKEIAPKGFYVGLHIRFAAPILQFQTYPQEWVDHYGANGYTLRDPTIAWGFSTTGACRWSCLPIPDPFDILGAAAKFGLVYGMTCSFGAVDSRTIASFASDTREFTDDEIRRICEAVEHLHILSKPPHSLTKAQREALLCIAEGDRYAAAAAKLGISESAFKARLISVRDRLMARTTAEALQRAKDYRLL